MNTIETIFLVGLFVIVYVLAFAIDYKQVKRHEKIKRDHLKSLKDETIKNSILEGNEDAINDYLVSMGYDVGKINDLADKQYQMLESKIKRDHL